jgi:hypothetical protein
MVYFFWVFLHIAAVVGFQYTGVLWFLGPAVAHILLIMIVYIIGVAAALDPNINVSYDENVHDYGPRFLVQVAILLTASQLFLIGYVFFAGMIALQATTLGVSIIFQKVSNTKL